MKSVWESDAKASFVSAEVFTGGEGTLVGFILGVCTCNFYQVMGGLFFLSSTFLKRQD